MDLNAFLDTSVNPNCAIQFNQFCKMKRVIEENKKNVVCHCANEWYIGKQKNQSSECSLKSMEYTLENSSNFKCINFSMKNLPNAHKANDPRPIGMKLAQDYSFGTVITIRDSFLQANPVAITFDQNATVKHI